MRILPIKNLNNQISHKAVNKKFLDKAIQEYLCYKPYHNQGPLIRDLMNRVILGLMSAQDGIDTLEAIKPLDSKNISSIEFDINELKKLLPKQ